MKPGGPLRRSTALAPGAPLVRRTPLRSVPTPRSGTPARKAPQPRQRPTVTPAERIARRLVKARSQGACEAGCGREATDWSHRVPRSQGGPWDAQNGLHLCRTHHDWCGDNPDPRCRAYARSAGWALKSWQDPATEPAWLTPADPSLPPGWYLLTPDGRLAPADCGRPRPVMPWERGSAGVETALLAAFVGALVLAGVAACAASPLWAAATAGIGWQP